MNILYTDTKQSLVYSSVRCSYLYLLSEWVRLGAETVVLTATEQNSQVRELNLQTKLWSSAHARDDASSQNDLHVFHGMLYLWKNILWSSAPEKFHTKNKCITGCSWW